MIKIGINGLGRIGRNLLKLALEEPSIKIEKINDIYPLELLIPLLKFDSVHGKMKHEISLLDSNSFSINGKRIAYSQEKLPSQINWQEAEFIVESSGQFKNREELIGHFSGAVHKVILSVPPSDNSVKMVVYGVNHLALKPHHDIISNASCTTNSAAHLINVLNNNFIIESCFITTVHSYTSDQNIQDGPHKDLRRARAAAQSIIPTSTGAAKALIHIFPDLADKLGGCGIRVPIPNGSLTDLTFGIKDTPSAEEINYLIQKECAYSLKGIVQFSETPLVSSDIIGNKHSCIFESDLTSVVGNMVKVVGWYDNEIGYSSRLIDLIKYVHDL